LLPSRGWPAEPTIASHCRLFAAGIGEPGTGWNSSALPLAPM